MIKTESSFHSHVSEMNKRSIFLSNIKSLISGVFLRHDLLIRYNESDIVCLLRECVLILNKLLVSKKNYPYFFRRGSQTITRTALHWTPDGKLKGGRPRATWRRTDESEIKAMKHSWGSLTRLVQTGSLSLSTPLRPPPPPLSLSLYILALYLPLSHFLSLY